MFVSREVLSCKPGKVGELKKKFQALAPVITRAGFKPFRVLTDVAGAPFWTLVLESEAESVEAFRQMEAKVMSDPEAQKIMAGYHDLVVSGRRELYTLES